ncbi:hypothetical protein L211DRAFT_662376 [Terfezia boudieri ATCC MYA-4762]|uniref:Protein FAF1 n=1 Tax=Terfezia boudieri ATCC MYA-4762 TaxID=1051890 RepID=A0A3N4LCH5_9PEZI|nr:hypothetical protein L211DRAFT_662376 [Terfezia boudieri ATCC MYA-4762]
MSLAVKIKRTGQEGGSASEGDGLRLTPEEILRRHFESQFAPLEESEPRRGSKRPREDDTEEEQDGEGDGLSYDEESGDEEANSDEDKYDGFSDISEEDALLHQADEEEDESGPQVVDYTGSRFKPTAILPKAPKSELKAFMSHKVPTLIPTTAPALTPNQTTFSKKRSTKSTPSDSDDEDAATSLKNDLALQRLLRESHLLDPLNSTTSTHPSLAPTGKNRHRAINTRIQALGGVDITKHKMPVPMKYAKAIAKEAREKKRVKVAKDGGIVLEKKTVSEEERRKREKEERKRRENRGFKPAVGKFKNGALMLSKKDIREIEGPKERSGGKGGKGKRSGGKGSKGKYGRKKLGSL